MLFTKQNRVNLTHSGRPDLIEKFASKHSNARYAMSGADNAMLLATMQAGAKACQAMTAKLQ